MGDFSQLSRFNPDANFKLVRIGADCPVLEVELNEMQDISEARHKHLIKSYFGNAIQGEGDYIYRDNTLTIQNESAFVDGNVVEITTLTTPLEEGEKVYLKVWEDTIRPGDVIKYKGNQQETRTVPNTLLDERIGVETSRRIQVKYDLAKETSEDATYFYLGKVSEGKFIIEASLITEDSRIDVDSFVAKGSQRVFVTKHTYKMGVNSLSVYVNGMYQIPTVDFSELTINSFKLNNAPEQGTKVIAVYQKSIQARTSQGHNSEHGVDGVDPIDISDLADRNDILPRIEDKLRMTIIDCGDFNDMSSNAEQILDGGVF